MRSLKLFVSTRCHSLAVWWMCNNRVNHSSFVRKSYLLTLLCIAGLAIYFCRDLVLNTNIHEIKLFDFITAFSTIIFAASATYFAAYSVGVSIYFKLGSRFDIHEIRLLDENKSKNKLVVNNRLDKKFFLEQISFHFSHENKFCYFTIWGKNSEEDINIDSFETKKIELLNILDLLSKRQKRRFKHSIINSIEKKEFYLVLHTTIGNFRCLRKINYRPKKYMTGIKIPTTIDN